jgi:hypothetical protein
LSVKQRPIGGAIDRLDQTIGQLWPSLIVDVTPDIEQVLSNAGGPDDPLRSHTEFREWLTGLARLLAGLLKENMQRLQRSAVATGRFVIRLLEQSVDLIDIAGK